MSTPDILDQRRLKAELAGIDVVYHLAAKVYTPFEPEDPHFFDAVINRLMFDDNFSVLDIATIAKELMPQQ